MINQGLLLEPGAIHARAKMSWQQINLRNESNNSYRNFELLNTMHEAGRVKCLSELPRTPSPAIVVGSGSTLDEYIEELIDWPYPIFCSSSQSSTLIKYGRPPDYLCLLDPTVNANADEFAVPLGSWEKTVLLTHPSAPKPYFERWFTESPRPAYLFRILEPTYDFYTHHLRWAYPWITESVLPFIDSGASCISLATRLGYNPIYLAGVDYGGPRFNMFQWEGGEWKGNITSKAKPWEVAPGMRGQNAAIDDNIVERMGPGGLETTGTMEYCQRGTMITAFTAMKDRVKKVRVYLLGGPSNLAPFIPIFSWAELKANNWQDLGPWANEFRDKWTDAMEIYLAHRDTFMVPLETGFPSIDYRVYMMNKERALPAMSSLNEELMTNKNNFAGMEKQFGMPVREMIEKEFLTLEKGELLIHSPEELATWDWKKMKPMDIEYIMNRIDWLLAQDNIGQGKPEMMHLQEGHPERIQSEKEYRESKTSE